MFDRRQLLKSAAFIAPVLGARDARALSIMENIASLGGAGKITLPYSPVLFMTGDSQSVGTLSTTDQAAAVAAYVVTPRVQCLNASGQWVTYTPGTMTGMDFAGNEGKVGSEIGFIPLLLAKYTNTFYIDRDGASGSTQTRGPVLGNTANLTSPGNNGYTLNSGTIAGNNILITGTGIETGCYIPFSPFLANVGLNGGRTGAAFGPTAIQQYNAVLSWSSTEGLAYNGNSAAINNGARARLIAALALLTSPRIIAHIHNIGTNDTGVPSGANMQTDLGNMLTRFGADLPYSFAKTILIRSTLGNSQSTAVRAAQLALRDQTKTFLFDTDSYTKWDGVHWDLAAHTDMGAKAFGVWQGTFTGI